jgi:recombination protein RecR
MFGRLIAAMSHIPLFSSPYSLTPLFPYSPKKMSKRIAGPEIERLIQLLARVPGLGPRSARRAALHLIKKKEALLVPLGGAMQEAAEKVRICSCCGNVDTSDPCTIRTDERRDPTTLIVVEDVSDLWALERAGTMNVRYHVLGGRLSPLDGIGPDDLNIKGLVERVATGEIKEVILAVNATVEGQTTAHYITDQLANFEVRVTRLAHGVPVGGELDYLDEGTLAAALRARTTL